MANVKYTYGNVAILSGLVDMATGGSAIRVVLCMNSTTCDTERDKLTNDGFSDIDELVASGYTAEGALVANQAVEADTTYHRAEGHFDDVVWSNLAAGARDLAGALVYLDTGDFVDGIPLGFIEFDPEITPDGTDFTLYLDAEGWCQL